MILYHFTALEYLDSIKSAGLYKGDVPTSKTEGVNAVWLTTDPDPSEHGLGEARPLNELERQHIFAATGNWPPDGARWGNKRAVRIKVVIPSTDRNLHYWPKWAAKRLTRHWFETMNRAGGGKAKTWYLYFGTLLPERFCAVDILEEQER